MLSFVVSFLLQYLLIGSTAMPVPVDFQSDPPLGFSESAQDYCIEQGGAVHVRAGVDGQIAICAFENGTECEVGEFFNEDCVKESDAGERFSEYDAEVFEVLDQALCTEKSDCELPMEYAVRSSCPFDVRCIENKCTVVCPNF